MTRKCLCLPFSCTFQAYFFSLLRRLFEPQHFHNKCVRRHQNTAHCIENHGHDRCDNKQHEKGNKRGVPNSERVFLQEEGNSINKLGHTSKRCRNNNDWNALCEVVKGFSAQSTESAWTCDVIALQKILPQ
mmetsp:Transcript_1508/g.2541  ORF Transcript_1508/g.2541 Transcript_1508/m.2541 type:complete len:131 (-) Transcript_1508:475-867(-)